ncbi:hypothetical protein PsYK624_034570 [Phanerochaete sordida]|uniref:Uncharacterized protein n=1 Tax=Phanerochaete sordida TaxID=48140 RepID=A0A9P3G3V2_9APHY|nr:hypothetical protein PsYK624_034570 [Phanerochaete sordida]
MFAASRTDTRAQATLSQSRDRVSFSVTRQPGAHSLSSAFIGLDYSRLASQNKSLCSLAPSWITHPASVPPFP